MLNKEKMTRLFTELLSEMTANPDPETPARATKYWCEVLEGALYTNEEIAKKFGKTFPVNTHQIVKVENIAVFSHCEHHLALMYDMTVSIEYRPAGKVLGLSKFGRIAQLCSRRLQLQERLTQDIFDVLKIILATDDIRIQVKGKHGCMTARGIMSRESFTETYVAGGIFSGTEL